ncbi:hypothetical protein LOD99_8692 [Oopsacas minuta]|uniref:Uncharacterized protein n=1 Tax=Oopsacas minuta TaxID=111878 RepID=A0AAV7JG44_9METZ|nr:hypothetical protein LOD99_8692 [Oopsacas minuta]
MATPITSTSKQECEISLGISIPENVWNDNPKFAKLLVEIATNKLGKFTAHSSTWSKHARELNEYNKQRYTHLQNRIVFDTIASILYEKSTDDTPVGILASHALDIISIHHASNLEQPLIAKKYYETFIKGMDRPEGLKMLRDSIVPIIDAKLTEIALKLLQLRDSPTDQEKPDLLLAKLKQLPSIIEQEIQTHEAYTKSKQINDINLQKNLEILLKKQFEYSKVLQIYFEENSEFVWNKESLEANLLLSKFQTMFEKLESIDQQILVDTYTSENVNALEIIHHKLIELKHSFMQEIHETKALLASYGMLGPEYTLVVEEYGQIGKQIEAAKDVLSTK